ncbi:MAG: hypothetical protein IJB65_07305 [Clostridia bacterium]|nr:hypothetical protein [Clostridia bacterium]
MLRALLKKQLLEIFCREAQPQKSKKANKAKPLIMYGLVYLLVFASVGFVVFQMADLLCVPFTAAGFSWLYFAVMGLMAIAVGVIGSVFSTYSSLYLAKDNDFLLAMPIKPRTILASRILGVFLTGFVFQLVVMAPALAAYYINVQGLSAVQIIMPLACLIVISLIVLCLSCLLGWLVALIGVKLKGKSYITVIFSLAFIVAYYVLYSKAYTLLNAMAANPAATAVKVKRYLYPLYKMGLGAAGDVADMLICLLCCVAFSVLVYGVLARTFLRIATATSSSAVKKTKIEDVKGASVSSALFRKELKRFTSSATYMLNCGLGSVIMSVVAVVLFIKGHKLALLINTLPLSSGVLMLIAVAFMYTSLSMSYISAPSVSLEGKNLWLIQSLPVSPMQILRAKIKLHLVLTSPPTALLTVALLYVLRLNLGYAILALASVGAYLVFMCILGLCLNLKMPNLNWTNETVPVKQSAPVTLCLMGGWGLTAALGGLYWVLRNSVSPALYLGAITLLMGAATFAMCIWLKKRGTVIFASL